MTTLVSSFLSVSYFSSSFSFFLFLVFFLRFIPRPFPSSFFLFFLLRFIPRLFPSFFSHLWLILKPFVGNIQRNMICASQILFATEMWWKRWKIFVAIGMRHGNINVFYWSTCPKPILPKQNDELHGSNHFSMRRELQRKHGCRWCVCDLLRDTLPRNWASNCRATSEMWARFS